MSLETKHVARIVVLVLALAFSESRAEILGGGGPIGQDRAVPCISPTERAFAVQLVEKYRRDFGAPAITTVGTPPKLTFFPLAGRLWRDLFVFNYVDVDPGAAFADWDCTSFAYNGHTGSDTDLRSFGEQVIGVPVFAAQDGVVAATHDGESDMNTVWAGQPANFVIVDHGSGREGWYWHLQKNSVAVSVGQQVFAGQQIGRCASSGVSTGPHLHFEIRDNGSVFEPFAGPCRAGESGWVDQPPLNRGRYLHDFGVTHESITAAGPWPNTWPRTGQIAVSDPVVRVWWYGTALPTGSRWRVTFKRPNGTTAFSSGNQSFGNPFWRWYNWWWTYNVPDMHSITGTWTVQLHINDVLAIQAPIEVVASRLPGFNRPPEPITVAFEPAVPAEGDVLSCQVATSLTLDDFDYDIVRYEYAWTVDGVEVRRVTTAAHSDVLSRNFVTVGAEIECSVTPGDGKETGTGDAVVVIVPREPAIPTVSAWGVVVTAMLLFVSGSLVFRNRSRISATLRA